MTKLNCHCKNVGKWENNGEHYCHLHVPKRSENCSICLHPMINSHYLTCGHYFHSKCIKRWIKKQNTCPICRAVIFDLDILKSYQDIFNKIDDTKLSIAIDVAIQCKNRDDFLNLLAELKILV